MAAEVSKLRITHGGRSSAAEQPIAAGSEGDSLHFAALLASGGNDGEKFGRSRAPRSEVEHIVKVAGGCGRNPMTGRDSGPVGTMLENPTIDFSLLARSMGMYAIGPVTRPTEFAPAFKSALQVVKSGQPALVDVVTRAR